MRKILFLLIIFLVAFNITGCGDKTEPSKTVQEPPETNQEPQVVEIKTPLVEIEPLVKKEKDLPGGFIVSIDNHRNAYPQSGLEKADRVYEILAEGGITRYLAVFHSQAPEKIGPIRSARYYFAYIVKGHDFPFAHAGGNNDAIALIPKLKIKDLDEIYNAGAFFYRDKSRKMPHNLYTNSDLLIKGAEKKKYALEPLKPLPQGDVAGGEEADLIDITYSTDSRYIYVVTYEWDGQRYKRYINGIPHETSEGTVIYTENVIVLEAKTRDVVKEELQSEIEVLGSGKAYFFTGGKFYQGTWKKEKAADEFEYLYEGQPMKFKGEHAWVNIVPSLKDVETTILQ
ncbi:MAG: DUF3048 domain-containing protein [Clostridia bacterium]|nr:DUF3048 domain-containing protein [Clostridia bacterium]